MRTSSFVIYYCAFSCVLDHQLKSDWIITQQCTYSIKSIEFCVQTLSPGLHHSSLSLFLLLWFCSTKYHMLTSAAPLYTHMSTQQSLAHSANPDQRETTHTHAASGLWTQTYTHNTSHGYEKTHAHQARIHRGGLNLAHPDSHPLSTGYSTGVVPLYFKFMAHRDALYKKGGIQSL